MMKLVLLTVIGVLFLISKIESSQKENIKKILKKVRENNKILNEINEKLNPLNRVREKNKILNEIKENLNPVIRVRENNKILNEINENLNPVISKIESSPKENIKKILKKVKENNKILNEINENLNPVIANGNGEWLGCVGNFFGVDQFMQPLFYNAGQKA